MRGRHEQGKRIRDDLYGAGEAADEFSVYLEKDLLSLRGDHERGLNALVSLVQNISEGGLLVKTPDTFDTKTEVTVRFNLPPIPHGRHIESKGVVIHAKPGVHMGIEFLQMKEEHRKAIAEFAQASSEGDM